MTGWKSSLLTAGCIVWIGCAGSVSSQGDGAIDATSEPALDVGDVAPSDADALTDDHEEMRDAVEEPVQVADVADVHDASDVTDTPGEDVEDGSDVGMECPRDPASGPPPDTGRSCNSSGAPSWQCREVAYCGGRYRMGALDALDVFIPDDNRSLPMRSCDLHDAVVRGGYADAYEVTVARYRAWVNAGMPHPRHGENFFNGLLWDDAFNEQLVLPDRATADERVSGVSTTDAMCTWNAPSGSGDDLPVNCVTTMAAVAFCWWDGKHLATEIAWEYLATNSGTTPTPFGSVVRDNLGCPYGDVGGYAGACPRNALPQRVGSHPMGATRTPAGIHDLWGGVQEVVIGLRSPYSPLNRPPGPTACVRNAETSIDGRFSVTGGFLADGEFLLRGAAWFQSALEHGYFAVSATRAGLPGGRPKLIPRRSVRQGIRCMRWLPEPR
jgi:formylglycine-generating enzyme required for sulfatase activity